MQADMLSDATGTADRADAIRSRYRTDARRRLQLALAAIWLLAGLLQLQAWMFTRAFADQVLAPAAAGQPALLAGPITWAASLVAHAPVIWNLLFGVVQVLLGLGIAWRPSTRIALAASIAWSIIVWWFGEGFGGLLTGGADPLTGAPGAVLLYALAAVLLWPTAASTAPPPTGVSFVASRPVGRAWARGIWVLLWGGLALLAVRPGALAPQALHDAIAGMGDGQPAWVAAAVDGTAHLVAHHGQGFVIAGAVWLALVALSALAGPTPVGRRVAQAGVVAALIACAFIWVVGEGLGMLAGGQATDVNSAPLLALIALAYWPAPPAAPAATSATSAAAAASAGVA